MLSSTPGSVDISTTVNVSLVACVQAIEAENSALGSYRIVGLTNGNDFFLILISDFESGGKQGRGAQLMHT